MWTIDNQLEDVLELAWAGLSPESEHYTTHTVGRSSHVSYT
jgi:hypothetical protein